MEKERVTKLSKCFTWAFTDPPITKKSLSKLDIASVINNSQLCHYVNFDRDIQSWPNMNNRNGKRMKEIYYWQAISIELDLYRWMLVRTANPGKVLVAKVSEKDT
jgi:hypothetical protein